ncbi:hypothetical protein [Mycoplasma capricolum]|uniref:hypothetical protein n=1 Tax=Mycoplasma capricolum TaxID=2095 RepID=UPI003DA4F5E3
MNEIISFNLFELVNRFSFITNKEKEFLNIAKQYTLTYPLKVSIEEILEQIESNKIEMMM